MDAEHALAMARYLMSLGTPGGAVSAAAPMLGPQGQMGAQGPSPAAAPMMPPQANSLDALLRAQPSTGGY